MPEFKIKRGDQFPSITIRIKNKKTGANFDLTGASGAVTFTLTDKDGNKTIDTVTGVIETPKTDGRVTYTWQGTDTDVGGRFRGEFELTGIDAAGGKKFSAPQSGFIDVFFEQDLNNA